MSCRRKKRRGKKWTIFSPKPRWTRAVATKRRQRQDWILPTMIGSEVWLTRRKFYKCNAIKYCKCIILCGGRCTYSGLWSKSSRGAVTYYDSDITSHNSHARTLWSAPKLRSLFGMTHTLAEQCSGDPMSSTSSVPSYSFPTNTQIHTHKTSTMS